MSEYVARPQSVTAVFVEGINKVIQRHGHGRLHSVLANPSTVGAMANEHGVPLTARTFALHFWGLRVYGNDNLPENLVLICDKIGSVLGTIDLTPPAPKPEFNAERDTVINVEKRATCTFERLVIPREAITKVEIRRGEIYTGYQKTFRGYHGPLKITLTLDDEPHAVTAFGQPCYLNSYMFYDDPAPKPAPKAEPEVDESWIWLAEQ